MALATKESVFAAADALTEKNASVTQIAIREALGGGSFSTIAAFLKEWRETRTPAPAVVESVPEALRDRLEALLAATWVEAMAAANAGVEAVKAAVEASTKTLQLERDEALAFADRVSSTVDAAEAKADDALGKLRIRDSELVTAKQQLAALNARTEEQASTIKTMRADNHKSQAEVARLTGELRASQEREAAADKRAAHEVAQRMAVIQQEAKSGKGKAGG